MSSTAPVAHSPRLRCASLSPVDLAHAWTAIETARAGGVGILDAAHARPARQRAARENLRACLDAIPAGDAASLGLRLTVPQLEPLAEWLDMLASRPHWIVLANWSPADLPRVLSRLAVHGREVWVEIGGGRVLHDVEATLPFTGWAACGAECGGLAGEESSFVLAQQLARAGRPFLVRGGIGVHSAAACAAAGAYGVVLDDTLHLLRESPLPLRWQHLIGRVGLTDTARVGAALGLPARILDRPEATAGRKLRATAERLALAANDDARAAWASAVHARVGWGEPEDHAWPVGEGLGRARATAGRYRSVGRLVRAVQDAARSQVAAAARLAPLRPGAPLAVGLGTRVPVVQGPMTRVSDTVSFAAAVAAAGGLPLLALALMRGPDVSRLLSSASERLQGSPWGIGILGFVPEELRQEQLAIVRDIRPPFAVISGGRPDQAAALDALGVSTFLHVPAPLLQPFLQQGTRRFIFEGGECGGHIGPLHSFTLWDYAVEMLVDGVSATEAPWTQVLFAGGIHDDLSAAMVAALAAPLSDHGVQIGVLMGTAYLFTEEAVACGAITPGFQREALAADGTATIETGPGHVIRCAATPFVETFASARQALIRSGVTGAELGVALEQLIAGRSRVASKGLDRDGERLVDVDAAQQHANGLYMLGEVAALCDCATTIGALHSRVSSGASARLSAILDPEAGVPVVVAPPRPADVAIVGASCLVPGARDVDGFWRNVLDGRRAITEIPKERWDWRLYYDPRPGARDRIVSRWGGFIDPIAFDPRQFAIPPNSLRSITPPQLLALELARRALTDAGYEDARPPAEIRTRTAVVFGLSNTADTEQLYTTRSMLPLIVPALDESIRDRLPEWTEESYPGLLPNVAAGRVANRFDFGGPNLTIDAACASSLAALDVAVRELVDGRSDLALAGGLEFEMSPQAFLGFSHTRALSPRGRADVFDRAADGIVISEGGVILVLKRLADAERDGDRIYAVIKSVAASSDGRGLSMTAPKSAGQRLALARAYAQAQIDPATIGLYEAHGTGTALGDAAEAESIGRVLDEAGAEAESCAIGSVKSLIGHTRTAAGMVALLKVALSLHHRVLPPHAGVTDPLPAISGGHRPLYLSSESGPWLRPEGHPRRAAASAFGFGGTNYHVVVEEHRQPAADATVGAATWPFELFVLAAEDAHGLTRALDRLARAAERLAAMPADGRSPLTLRDLAYAAAVGARRGGTHRAAIVAESVTALLRGIAAAKNVADGGVLPASGVYVGNGEPLGGLAFLFPGQGSQEPGMGRDVATYFTDVRSAIEEAARAFAGRSLPLVRAMWPPAAPTDAERDRQRTRLADTVFAQPAIGALSCGLLDLVRRLGLRATAVAGHSYGELVALHAARCLDRAALLTLSKSRGLAMASAESTAGAMAVLAMGAAAAAECLRGVNDVVIANLNAPKQTVISGAAGAVRLVVDRARAAGAAATLLPVSGAFHSPLMRPARAALDAAIAAATFCPPELPVFANLDGRPYPSDSSSAARRLSEHLEQPVDFVAQVNALYESGARAFLELGPGHVLTRLVPKILGDRAHVATSTDGGLKGLLKAVAVLYAAGYAPDAEVLFAGRPVRWVDLDRLPDVPDTARHWHLDGGRIWAADAVSGTSGVAPFLDAVTAPTAPACHAGDRATLPELPLTAPRDAGTLAAVYREYEQTMRRFLDQQERMLAHIIGSAAPFAGHSLASESPVSPMPAVLPAPSPVPAGTDRDSLLARLVRIAADRTGYADDAIGTDLDLEADLGIDSIKRIDMITTFAGSFGEADASLLQSEVDRLIRLRTLNAMAAAASTALGTRRSKVAARAARAETACARFVMRPVERSALHTSPRRVPGLHLIATDGHGLSSLVTSTLQQHGADAGELSVEDLGDTDRLSRRIAELRARFGPVRGVVHLVPVGRPVTQPDAWRAELVATTLSLFHVLKLTADDLAEGRGVVLAATALGGSWGRDGCRSGAELAAGCHGLIRSFEREYPEVTALVVDVDEARPLDERASQVVREYLSPSDREVGYRDGRRWTVRAEAVALDDAPPHEERRVQAGWVILATGGARGITAEVCDEMAVPGVQFILVGRGAPGGAIDDERQRNIDRLKAAGAGVELLTVDVGDDAAFGAAVEDVYRRHGRIDAVLHGAGVIHDQRFQLKTADTVEDVSRAKVGGAFTLARHLRPEGLQWVVFFGSVSGRFGNAGQTDYAAANEVLNRLAWTLHRRWPASRVVTINWGPWRGLGMAGDATLALLKARGIQPIDPGAGRRFVVNELMAGGIDDCEVIAGDGPWAVADPEPDSALDSSGPPVLRD